MAYSEVDFTYSGGPQVFPTNFALGVLEAEHIVVNVDGQVDGLGNPIAFNFTYDTGTGEVTVINTLTIGWTGSIRRITPVANLLVDFDANADVTKRNLARSTKQVLMAVQEAEDGRAADRASVANLTALYAGIAVDVDAAEAAAVTAVAAAASAAAKEASMITGTGQWLTATVYTVGDLAYQAGSQYECIIAHTSTVFATDLGDLKWRLFASKGADAAVTGDMFKADLLSGMGDAAAYETLRLNIGIDITRLMPSGAISPFARNTPPTGWLKADGALVSRATYAALFAAIGTTFGVGDGSTTFGLPDLRGEFVRAWDDGRGVDAGRAFGSAQGDANKAHTHGITDPGHVHSTSLRTAGSTSTGAASNNSTTSTINTGSATTGITVNSDGEPEARPRNIALLMCIKT